MDTDLHRMTIWLGSETHVQNDTQGWISLKFVKLVPNMTRFNYLYLQK